MHLLEQVTFKQLAFYIEPEKKRLVALATIHCSKEYFNASLQKKHYLIGCT
jgi:hypothetical protein